MGAILAEVTISNPADRTKRWQGEFLIDTGAIDTVAPAKRLREIGIQPEETRRYVLADGSVRELEVGLARIEFMGGVTGVAVVFADDDVRPLLGATAMESLGIEIDMRDETLRRLPAVQL
ncbi:MAG: clan AA aspartic protease [Chloroflexi bacterium]|nr:clan AA aspartic protease [Chloroflexota bacterium]